MDDDFEPNFDDSDFEGGDFEQPNLDDILGYGFDVELPEVSDILGDFDNSLDDIQDAIDDTEIDNFELELGAIADDINEQTNNLDEIVDLAQEALDQNMHPNELYQNIDGLASDEVIQQSIDQYKENLTDKLGLNDEGVTDDGNFTSRGSFETYDDLIAYLDSFHGGFPADDIFEIELTDEGYELYVAENTP